VRTWGAAVLRPHRNVLVSLVWAMLNLNPAIWEAIAGTGGEIVAGETTELPMHETLGEGVVARADAHGVVPGDGEGPPR
jgi:hypothetical protein